MDTVAPSRTFPVHEALAVPACKGARPLSRPTSAVQVPTHPNVFIDASPYLAMKAGLGAPNEAHLQIYVGDAFAGYITWGKSYYWDNVIEPSNIKVLEAYRGRGLATLLWRAAQQHDGLLVHSEVRTPAGHAWALATSDEVPEPHFSSEQARQAYWDARPDEW